MQQQYRIGEPVDFDPFAESGPPVGLDTRQADTFRIGEPVDYDPFEEDEQDAQDPGQGFVSGMLENANLRGLMPQVQRNPDGTHTLVGGVQEEPVDPEEDGLLPAIGRGLEKGGLMLGQAASDLGTTFPGAAIKSAGTFAGNVTGLGDMIPDVDIEFGANNPVSLRPRSDPRGPETKQAVDAAMEQGLGGTADALLGIGEENREFYGEMRKDIEQEVPASRRGKDFIDDPSLLFNFSYLAEQSTESVVSMLPPLAAAFMSGGSTILAGAIGGGMEMLGALGEMLDDGMQPDEALVKSGAYGTVSAALNAYSFGKIFDKRVVDGLIKKGAKILAASGVEAFTEWLEGPIQALAQYTGTLPMVQDGSTVGQSAARGLDIARTKQSPQDMTAALTKAAREEAAVIPGSFIAGGGAAIFAPSEGGPIPSVPDKSGETRRKLENNEPVDILKTESVNRPEAGQAEAAQEPAADADLQAKRQALMNAFADLQRQAQAQASITDSPAQQVIEQQVGIGQAPARPAGYYEQPIIGQEQVQESEQGLQGQQQPFGGLQMPAQEVPASSPAVGNIPGQQAQGLQRGQASPAVAETMVQAQTPLDQKAHEAATSPLNDLKPPTKNQELAGNYKKGHDRIRGMDISIENPAGSVRSGKDAQGREWQTEMKHHYGYIKGTKGADKDHIDVFVGPDPEGSQSVFVVNQVNPKTGKFDEHKAILGAANEQAARDIYLANYEPGWQGLGSIVEMSMDGFKKWSKTEKTAQPAVSDISKADLQGAGTVTAPSKGEASAIDRREKALEDLDALRPNIADDRRLTTAPNVILMNVRDMQEREVTKLAAPYDGTREDAVRVARLLRLHAAEEYGASMRQSETFGTDAEGRPIFAFRQGEGDVEMFDLARKEESKPDQERKALVRQEKPKKPLIKKAVAERNAALTDYFTPGNIVKGYGGHDRVISFTPPDRTGAGWSVTVQAVKRDDAGNWIDDGERQRTHATMPSDREMKAGPARRVESKPAQEHIAPTSQEERQQGNRQAQQKTDFTEEINQIYRVLNLGPAAITMADDSNKFRYPKAEAMAMLKAYKRQYGWSDEFTRDVWQKASSDMLGPNARRVQTEPVRYTETPSPEWVQINRDKTVEADIPEAQKEKLTLKQQKDWLLAEIDKAMESKRTGGKPFEFHVPGDGHFRVKPANLATFKAAVVARFPEKGSPSALGKNTPKEGRDIKTRVNEGEYYNEWQDYQIKLDSVFKQSHKADPFPMWDGKTGVLHDANSMVVLAKKPLIKGLKDSTADTGRFIEHTKREVTERAEIVGQVKRQGLDNEGESRRLTGDKKTRDAMNTLAAKLDMVFAHVRYGDKDAFFPAERVDAIRTQHPGAEAMVDKTGTRLGFYKDGKLVGVTMGVENFELTDYHKARIEEIKAAKEGRPSPLSAANAKAEAPPLTKEEQEGLDLLESLAKGEAPKQAAQQPEPSKAPEKIEDFGEKIEGAKKDLWTGLRDKMDVVSDEEIASQPLSKIWPLPDYQALIDAGTDKQVVAYLRAMRDAIPTKPQKGWKLAQWVEVTKGMRGNAMSLMDGNMTLDQLRGVLDRLGRTNRPAQNVRDQADLYLIVGHGKSLAGVRVSVGEYGIFNSVKYDPPKRIWSVEQAQKATAFSNWPRMLAMGDTREEAIENFKKKYDVLSINEPAAKQADFDIYSKVGTGEFFVGKKIGRNYIDLAGPFDSAKEARAYKFDNQDELVEKLAKAKEIPRERRDTNNPRVGEDMRGGQDVTPEMFQEAFGFRGVQFGNYVEQGRRQEDLNEAYDALMDLAAVLNVSPKALSLNGELGLAFGARGSGGKGAFAAHYEPGMIVINLTKKRGAGSLGHEWWHALDNYFSRMRGKKSDMMTEAMDVSLADRKADYEVRGAVRKEMIEAFGAVTRAIKQTALKARSRKLDDKRTKDYWTTKPEMSARAFESYLISKLHDQGASNDYFANIVDEATWKAAESLGFELGNSYPYPTAGEIPTIRAAFDEFFTAIEAKETDRGVALYQVAGDATGHDAAKAARPKKQLMRARHPVRIEDVQKVFHWAKGVTQDGNTITIDLGDRLLNIRLVGRIIPGENDFILGYGRKPGPNDFISGAYTESGEILASVHAGKWTVSHEFVHDLQAWNLLTTSDMAALDRGAKGLTGLDGLSRQEKHAYLIERALQKRDFDRSTELGRVLQKIVDFFDAIVNLVRRTARGVVRDVESGRIMGRKVDGQDAAGSRYQLAWPDQFKDIPRKYQPQLDYLRMKFQDKFLPLLRAQEALTRGGWTMTPESDAYRAEELFHGKAGARLEKFQKQTVAPLLEKMRDAGVTLAELEDYLYAKYTPQRNAYVAGINKDMPDGGSGRSDKWAADTLAAFDKAGKTASLEALAKDVRAITKMQRDIIRDEGLEADEIIDAWEAANPDYVPLKGGKETTRRTIGTGYNVKGSGTKRALGRQTPATDILAHLFAQVGDTIIRAEKVKVSRAFLKMAEENPEFDGWRVHEQLPKKRALVNKQVKDVTDMTFPMRDNVLTVTREDGSIRYVEIFDDDLARVMKNLTPGQHGKVTQALASITRFLSMVNTSLNPEFVVTNFERDLLTASIHLSGEQAKGMTGKIVKDIPSAMRGIHNHLRGDDSKEWAVWFDMFKDAGAQVSFMDLRGIDQIKKDIEAMATDKRAMAKGRATAARLLNYIADVNTAVENAVRLSAFKNLIESGMSESDAASIAKNLTVNFNRKGELGPAMNALYMFFNAGVQGSTRILFALGNRRVQKMMGAVTLMAMGLAEMNALTGGDDDDGENKWDKHVSDWTRQTNLVFMLPSGDSVKIKMPYGYNFFVALGYALSDVRRWAAVNGGKNPAEAVTFLFHAGMNAFNPMGDDSLLQMLSPTVLDPFVQVAVNENFMGNPIAPEQNPFGPEKPNSQLYFRSVSKPAQAVAEWINGVSGGDRWNPGAVDISPEWIDHFTGFLTGGLGRTVRDTAFLPATLAEPDVDVRQVPFLRQIYQERSDRSDMNRFYDNAKEIDKAAATFKELPLPSKREFLKEHPEVRLHGEAERLKKQLSFMRKSLYNAQDKGDVKRAHRLEEKMRQVVVKFNKRLGKTER